MKYKVIKDSRERQGWNFIKTEKCVGTEISCLKIADYSLEGFEDIFLIERKLTPNEFAANIFGKDAARFERELEKLNQIKHAYVILEFGLTELLGYPYTDISIPYNIRRRIKISGKFLISIFNNIQIKFSNIKFIFAGDSGKQYAMSLFAMVSKLYPERIHGTV